MDIWKNIKSAYSDEIPLFEYERFEDGEYDIFGVREVFSTDERQLPCFKISPLNGKLKANLRLMLSGGKEGPPFSATVAELAALAHSFGKLREVLPVEPTSDFLIRFVDALSTPAKTPLRAVVKKGWVSYFRGPFGPPMGEYYFRIEGIRSLDGSVPVSFRHSETYHADIVMIDFEIVAEAGYDGRRDTPFAGFRVSVPLVNPFDGVRDGRPATLRNPEGSRSECPMQVYRLRRLIAAFAPTAPNDVDWEEYRWKNASESPLGINELENPIAVIAQRVKELGLVRRGVLEYTDRVRGSGRAKVDLMSFVEDSGETDSSPAYEESASSPVHMDEVRPAEPHGIEHMELITLLDRMAGFPVFKETPPDSDTLSFELTEKGRRFCRDVVKPVWDRLGIPHGKVYQFASLSRADAKRLKEALAQTSSEDAGF